MLMNIIDLIELNIYEIKVNKRNILLNNEKISIEIEYILLISSNMKYKLKFYDIYEKLILSIPIFPNSIIEYNENKIRINTM